jgi:hypothetical protein
MELIVVYKQEIDNTFSVVDINMKPSHDDIIYPIVTSFKKSNLFVFEYNPYITYKILGNKFVFLDDWIGDLYKNNSIVNTSEYKIVMIEQCIPQEFLSTY